MQIADDDRKGLADLEEKESIRAYDAAKAPGEKAMPFQIVTQEIDRSRK